MKKLLMSSLVLLIFSLSIFIFQISCQKSIEAQSGGTSYTLPPATASTLGGIVVGNGLNVTSGGVLSVTCCGTTTQTDLILYNKHIALGGGAMAYEYWVCLKDGSNKRQIIVPSTITVRDGKIAILADKNAVVFSGSVGGPTTVAEIYTMNIDGSNLQKIVAGNASTDLFTQEVYW